MASQAHRQASLEQAIKEATAQLSDEEADTEAEPMHQLRWLSKLAIDLKKQVQEMKTSQQLSIPHEVLQQRKHLENQVVGRLREAENTCAETMEEFSTTWEQLIDD